jgi:hypothetical protein
MAVSAAALRCRPLCFFGFMVMAITFLILAQSRGRSDVW